MLSDRPRLRSPCCACGTATYEMEFRGLWIRQLHPRGWPEPDGAVHWTNIIGASHDSQYSIYNIGQKASHGVSDVCDRGETSTLESDFKEAGDRILSIIKTRGILGGKYMSEKRTAIFSVDRTHHFMSMLTMLGPSPDWFAGISSFNLCQYNCTWARQRVLKLYPWDAGIFKGNEYKHTQFRETPPHSIRNITKNWPQGNPFSIEPDGRIRPVAEVTITRFSPKKDHECTRQSIPGVTAVNGEQNDEKDTYGRQGKKVQGRESNQPKVLTLNLQQMLPKMCFMTQWSDWSQCSVTCGTGSHTRERKITRNLKPALCNHVKLQDKRPCTGVQQTCDISKPCSVSAWSQWGPCSASCNSQGTTMRQRTLIMASEAERCSKLVQLSETRNCTLRCDDTATCSKPVLSGVQCFEPKTRYYYDMVRRACLPFKYLGCKGSRNRFRTKQQCAATCSQAFDIMPSWQVQRLAQQQKLANQKARLLQKGRTLLSCKKPMDLGHRCRHKKRVLGPSNRWYFNMKTRKCDEMVFRGCSGNDNNFFTELECKITCAKLLSEANRRFLGPPQDCVVGSWGPWGPCTSKCRGRRIRKRVILKAPMNGGRRCPGLFNWKRCNWKKCSPCEYTQWSSWSACTVTCGTGWQERTRQKRTQSVDCREQTPGFVDRAVCTRKKCPKRKSFYYI